MSQQIGLDDCLVYRMNRPSRGMFIIINNENFHPKTGLGVRRGSSVDAVALSRAFESLGFRIVRYQDIACEKMMEIMKEAGTIDHTDSDCFGCAILSHGEEEVVYGTDGQMCIKTLLAPLKGDCCPSLVQKPKLCFIEASRGTRLDTGVQVLDSDTGDCDDGLVFSSSLPSEADCLYVYSTVPGYVSWRNTETCSCFAQTLCKVLDEWGTYHDVMTVLTRVCYIMAAEFETCCGISNMNNKKQVPSIECQLTKRLYFTPKSIARSLQSNPESADDSTYKMDHKRRGDFIIFANANFDPRTRVSCQTGNLVGAVALQQTFQRLGFNVQVHCNQTRKQMMRIMTDAGSKDSADADCFGCAVLTMGEGNVIYATDGSIPIDVLFEPLKGDSCPSLVKKPKLFFVQASRGEKMDSGISFNDEQGGVISHPIEADFLYAYSTPPGFFSWRNQARGSIRIQALRRVLQDSTSDDDILTLLTHVNHMVASQFESNNPGVTYLNRSKQIPSVVTQLTKRLFLNCKK